MRRFGLRCLWLLLLVPALALHAEKVADLPMPTAYVNDFAQVISPAGRQQIEDVALAVHRQANAELVVVTIKSLDDGQSIEEFSSALEEKWKIGKKGQDRSTLLLLVISPHKLRIETGYGLEGALNDAKAGAILDQAKPFASAGNYDEAMLTAEQGIANIVAADAHVTLTPIVHQYHRQQAAPQKLGIGQIVLGLGVLVVLFILIKTGNIGWAFYLVMSLMGGGGGGGGGGGRDDDNGGGFGGSGGGESGGGGASRDF